MPPKGLAPGRGFSIGRPRRRPPILGELLIVYALLEVYGKIRALADTRYEAALENGKHILRLERLLYLDVELGLNQWLTRHDAVSRVASEVYQHTHTGFTMFILLWCYVAGAGIYRPARNALVLINVVGLAVFFVLPVMPPRLIPGGGYVDTVAGAGYGTAHSGPISMSPAQYAAMPSLHTAWAIWVMVVAMVLLRRYRRLRWIAVVHPLSTAVVIVLTANHYVLDVVAGAVLAWAAALIFGLSWADQGTPFFGGQFVRRPRPADGADPPPVAPVVIAPDPPAAAPSPPVNGTAAAFDRPMRPMRPDESTRPETEGAAG